MTVAASKIGGVISDLLAGYRDDYLRSRQSEHRYSTSRSEGETRTH
jgi:hypothetical protein